MANNKEALKACLELSHNINEIGTGINANRAAKEVFSQLVKSSADLGASITAVEYVPLRSHRAQVSAESMQHICRIIYLLNVAKGIDYFMQAPVDAAIKSAVKVSELLVGISSIYGSTGGYINPVQSNDQKDDSDPDGFNELFEG
ncbi:MAG: hypothetical protein LUD19_03955 [Clostridia bacterium]|nr:hypothetical protein [Clostridia bacterium]